jgi:beta-glucanase (GH16 family)
MNLNRFAASLVAVITVSAATIPVAASALPSGHSDSHSAKIAKTATTTMLRKHVPSAGVYDLTVTVHSSTNSLVTLHIGHFARRTRTLGVAHRAKLRVRLTIKRHTITISASSALVKPRLNVKLVDVSTASAGGSKGSTGTSGKPSTSPSSAPATRASGPFGPTGPTGSNDTTAATPAPTPAPASTAYQDGPFYIPDSFAPVADYSTLTRDYEFTGSALPADWSTGTDNYGFQATQFQPSQVSMTGSSVALTATNQTSPNGSPYSSGWISTVGAFSFQYGMVDYRAKMPAGQGLWSGLWLASSPNTSPDTEIDVQEMLLGNTHNVFGSLHSWGPGPNWEEQQYAAEPNDMSAGFNDFQVIWQPGMVTWAVNGVAYAQYTEQEAVAAGQTWPYDGGNGVYLIADLAVGGASDWGGAPDSTTVFPATMQIQSVKVWE